MKIDEVVDKYLSEAKMEIDLGFEYVGKNMQKVKITYINPKSKKLPHWAQVGKEVKSDMLGHFEVEYGAEVFNLNGRTVKNGYVIESNGEKMDEGIWGNIKSAFTQGMKDELKKSIDPKWHKIYGVDKVTSYKEAAKIIKKAKLDGNLIS